VEWFGFSGPNSIGDNNRSNLGGGLAAGWGKYREPAQKYHLEGEISLQFL
jgi:hypothetical protein